ncbi:MAG TPA: S41 family peptidase [Bacteroidia bacterium]|nr:S41 family peptidase [Bacteroidia bacterium]QQR94118.1 MAG: S41 family peptidase [Bacteroidota bacterium]MBP7713168.1 S41 family peptidase [Bacteroidia bacterium]MBP8667283.1 S41 family peptidase [Bacteroidia bacterium]HOZ82846.1 S41 family peptidase [Bacteroidia bacterium]
MQSDQKKNFQPLWYALLITVGIVIGVSLNSSFKGGTNILFSRSASGGFNKINDVVNYIRQEYVDTINQQELVNSSITQILQNLDPHSSYIPADELKSVNEPLEGNFEGIGIEFHIQYDTIMVVSTIAGGPSETIGLRPGDRIVEVDKKKVAGIGIKNEDVFKYLRGQEGTKVALKVKRSGIEKLLDFTIVRGKIPIRSIETSFMANANTGFIKISRFSATTYDEFMEAVEALKKQGMQNLILDLRGNPGGYLDAATMLADEFLPDKKLIVYTEGKARPRKNYYATEKGDFEKGKVFVLIDEGSASASEILAGALQDWDRAEIIGRRSFGKGLVQEQTLFPDGSAMRLTVARYYTPTGRSIQKPYKNGYMAYEEEVYDRFKHGEMVNADSTHFNDSLKYTTPGGKIVYGGGGIMPDVFIPIDTTADNEFARSVFGLGLVSRFSYDYTDKHRNKLNTYKSIDEYIKNFSADQRLLSDFFVYAIDNKVRPDEKSIHASRQLIANQLKANIGRLLFGNDAFYRVVLSDDKAFNAALQQAESTAQSKVKESEAK